MTYAEIKKLYGDAVIPYFGMHIGGEKFLVSHEENDNGKYYKFKTFQHNGWIRINIYYENGDYEELYEKPKTENKISGWSRPPHSTPKSYIFVCDDCGNQVYAKPIVRSNRESECDYEYCPYCGKHKITKVTRLMCGED